MVSSDPLSESISAFAGALYGCARWHTYGFLVISWCFPAFFLVRCADGRDGETRRCLPLPYIQGCVKREAAHPSRRRRALRVGRLIPSIPGVCAIPRRGVGHVKPRVLQVLAYLLAHRGPVVPKPELMQQV